MTSQDLCPGFAHPVPTTRWPLPRPSKRLRLFPRRRGAGQPIREVAFERVADAAGYLLVHSDQELIQTTARFAETPDDGGHLVWLRELTWQEAAGGLQLPFQDGDPAELPMILRAYEWLVQTGQEPAEVRMSFGKNGWFSLDSPESVKLRLPEAAFVATGGEMPRFDPLAGR